MAQPPYPPQPQPGYPQPQGVPGYRGAPAYQGQPGGYPPPRPSGSPAKLLLLGLVAVIAVGFFAFSLMSFLNSDDQVTPQPLPTPEIGETSAPPTGVPEPDMNPSNWPAPKDGQEAEQWLVNNALYQQSVQVPVNCTLGRVDVETISAQEMETHLNTLTGCLMMVWREPLERAGFEMPRPPVTVYSAPITTACGEAETYNAFYCTLDQRVYYAMDIHELFRRNDPNVIDNAFLPDNVIGHEFGHAIQARTGIWASFAGFRAGASEEGALELGRRNETQADCFAGVFLNAVAQASRMTADERVGLGEISYAIGDDRLSGNPSAVGDHGHGVNRQYWFETGLASPQVGVCNTWTAPSDRVR